MERRNFLRAALILGSGLLVSALAACTPESENSIPAPTAPPAPEASAIHPFVTYAVSGMARVDNDYSQLRPQSTIGEGLAVHGEEARQAQPDVEAWLRRIGLRADHNETRPA